VTHDRLPKVFADSVQLERLFQNLIGNALKYRKPDAKQKVHITAKNIGGEWVFAIKDEGIGIAKEHFERIFVIFQRLHTMKEYSGTGIGLSVCQKIAQYHGGKIWVESEPDKGSTFYFTIADQQPQETA